MTRKEDWEETVKELFSGQSDEMNLSESMDHFSKMYKEMLQSTQNKSGEFNSKKRLFQFLKTSTSSTKSIK